MWPVIVALKELGGSATVGEIYERVTEAEGFTEEQQAVLTNDGKSHRSSTDCTGPAPISRASVPWRTPHVASGP
jgi:hypothetical protein